MLVFLKSPFSQIWALLCILLFKAGVMIGLILHGNIGLGPDEAQYWTWSQNLAWGYYSKPPAIAWQIWLGTQVFGNTELGVRFLSVIFSFLLSLSVYGIAIACRTRPLTAFWAAIVMALSPLGILSSLFATTDIGMVLFWSLACIVIADSLFRHQTPNYYLLGFLIFCGALFKWPIYLFWVLVIAFAIPYRFLLSKHLLGGIVLSLLGLFPSVVWNMQHEWATFRHVATTVVGDSSTKTIFHGNILEFVGAQAMLLSPIFFGILIFGFWLLFRHRKAVPPPLIFCGASSALILIAFCFLSIFKKMQGNWCVYAYPSGIVFLSWYACERVYWGRAWLKTGLCLSIALSIFMLSIPYIQSQNILNSFKIPYGLNSFRHNLGWNNLTNALNESGYDPATDFLFADKYQMSSILSFYGPKQQRAYFLNLHGVRKNQFSFWPGMAEEQRGKTGFFVLSENQPHLFKTIFQDSKEYQAILENYFDKVQFIGTYPLFESYHSMAKGTLIFKCIGYNGQVPPESHSY